MNKVVLLACEDLTGYVVDDDLLVEPLAAAGWQAEFIPWSAPSVDWRCLDAVVIRATWDYHYKLEHFLETLRHIESLGVPLFNSRAIVEWNAHKKYLLELEAAGVPIVPTRVYKGVGEAPLDELFAELGADELVVKPMVSAGAFKTHRFTQAHLPALMPQLQEELSREDIMVQPFIHSLLEKGEYSLFYFNGEYSHAISKTPVPGDFRVQEEWGGIIEPTQPLPGQREVGEKVLRLLPEPCLYARVDLVESPSGQWQVMEVELIEPSLYLRTDAESPQRFVRAFQQRMG